MYVKNFWVSQTFAGLGTIGSAVPQDKFFAEKFGTIPLLGESFGMRLFCVARFGKDFSHMRLANRAAVVMVGLGVSLAGVLAAMPLLAATFQFNAPQRGLPGRREGGGTRGDQLQLVALLPRTNLGLTTAAYPRFFWSVPSGIRAKYVEFSLFQGEEQAPNATLIYRTTFEIAGTPGIASLTLPETADLPPLEVGKDYQWSVKIAGDLNNLNDPQRNFRVNGWVQRVTPSPQLSEQLSQASLPDRAALYAQNGFWFDTLDVLAKLRCENPNDRAAIDNWTTLLKSEPVRLDRLASQPLLQSCAAKPE